MTRSVRFIGRTSCQIAPDRRPPLARDSLHDTNVRKNPRLERLDLWNDVERSIGKMNAKARCFDPIESEAENVEQVAQQLSRPQAKECRGAGVERVSVDSRPEIGRDCAAFATDSAGRFSLIDWIRLAA